MPETTATAAATAQKTVQPLFTYTGRGVTSRQNVTVSVEAGQKGRGVVFLVRDHKSDAVVELPAHSATVINTLRNVTLGKESARLCIVEHFLAAVSLWGLDDLNVNVDGLEMPLGDGSANFWIDLLSKSGVEKGDINTNRVGLTEAVNVIKGDRSLLAIPDSQFSVTYLMDWKHPLIGKRWQSWNPTMPITEITDARTFGSLKEHQMLGLTQDVVSLTDDGFSEPLRFEDEPVRHKLLDLIGDLTLLGFNPLRLNARVISIKAGHEMDVQLARQLIDKVQK